MTGSRVTFSFTEISLVVSPESVRLMTGDRLTEDQRPGDEGFGFCVGHRRCRTDEEHVGTYGWAGGLGSIWMTDPGADLVRVLLTSQAFGGPDGAPILVDFRRAAYESIA